jgi:1,4-dihydroxy-2-naphthoate octaprenyltransferase
VWSKPSTSFSAEPAPQPADHVLLLFTLPSPSLSLSLSLSPMVSLSTLLFITRPWSFPVTVCAISVGGSLAFVDAPDRFSWLLFLLSLTAALFIHAAVNLINTLGDYSKGVDVKNSADDRALVDGVVTVSTAFHLTLFCVAVACTILGVICYTLGHRPAPPSLQGRTLSTPLIDLLILCACGFFVGYAYTGPPFWWKYRGLGDLCIIAGYGPLLTAGGYYCQLSTLPPLSSLAFTLIPGLLTDTILHVNNTRDQQWDAQCGAVTLPMKLGKRWSGYYFIGLFVYMFAFVIATAVSPTTFLPQADHSASQWRWAQLTFLLPLVLIPEALDLIRRYYAADFKDLCPRCGQVRATPTPPLCAATDCLL